MNSLPSIYKLSLTIILLFGMLPQSYSQTKFKFLGVTIRENLGCVNPVKTKTEETLLVVDETYREKRAAFENSIKASNPSYDIFTADLEPGKKMVIALVAKKRICRGSKAIKPEVESYEYFSAEDEEGITKKMDSEKKLYKEITQIEILRLIPWEHDIAKMMETRPKPKGEFFKKNLDGLLIKSYTNSAKKFASVYFLNKNSSKTAIVAIIDELTGKPLHLPTMLEFDKSMNIPIKGSEKIEIDVKFIDKTTTPAAKSSLIDYLKKRIRQQVINKKEEPDYEYREKLDASYMGVRG